MARKTKDDESEPQTVRESFTFGNLHVRVRDSEADSVELFPGVRFPRLGVTMTDDPHQPSGLRVEVDVIPLDGQVVIQEVRATRHERPVTLAALRSISLTRYLSGAIRCAHISLSARTGPFPVPEVGDPGPDYIFWEQMTTTERDRLREQGPTDETLRWVGALYRLVSAFGMAPVKSLCAGFGVSPRTMNNWVAAARAAGYLEDKGE